MKNREDLSWTCVGAGCPSTNSYAVNDLTGEVEYCRSHKHLVGSWPVLAIVGVLDDKV